MLGHNLLLQRDWFLARPHTFQPLCRAVMERAEPSVPWHFCRTVIALEIPMMQLVKEGAHVDPSAFTNDQRIIAGVRCRGRQCQPIGVKQHVDRVRRNDQMDQQRRKVDRVFYRVHREAGPRADGDVAVMHGMDPAIEGCPVQEAMYPVEVERIPDADQRKP